MLAVFYWRVLTLLVLTFTTDYCNSEGCFGDSIFKVANKTSGMIRSDEVVTQVTEELKCIWLLNATFTAYRVNITVMEGGDHVKFKEIKDTAICTYTQTCSQKDNPDGCFDKSWWNLNFFGKCYTGNDKTNTVRCRPCFFEGGEELESQKTYCYKTNNCGYDDTDCEWIDKPPPAIEYTLEKKKKKNFSLTYEFINCDSTSQANTRFASTSSAATTLNPTTESTAGETETTSERNVTQTDIKSYKATTQKQDATQHLRSDGNTKATLFITLSIVGGFLLVVLVLILVVIIYRRRRVRNESPASKEMVDNEIYNMEAVNSTREIVDNMLYASTDTEQKKTVDNVLYATTEDIS